MDTNPRFTEAAIQGYIAEHRGTRFRADHLASTFGAGNSAMRETLENMARQGLLRRGSDGKKTFFYLPDDAQIALESNAHRARPFKELQPDPRFLERVADSRAHRAQFPSKHI